MKKLFILLSLLFISACGSTAEIDSSMSRDIVDLSAKNQHGEQVDVKEEMKGDYWVANMIFTSCTTVCPPMTSNMSRLQDQIEQEGLDIRLASFSIDPSTDDVKTLKQFADKYNPDYGNWSFYTGYPFEEIKELSIKSFQSPVQKLENSDQYAHATGFFLVTPEGKVIKNYEGTNSEAMETIMSDLKKIKGAS